MADKPKQSEAERRLQAENDQLRSQIAEINRQIREQNISQMPPEQRPLAQRQAELEEERANLARERDEINQAARIVTARQLSVNTGLPEDEFLKFDSIVDMNAFATERVLAAFDDPTAASHFLGRIQAAAAKAGTPTTGTDQGSGGTTPAAPAGASAVPAGAQQPQGSQTIPKVDPTAELLKDPNIGKDSGNLEGFLSQYLGQQDFEEISLRPGAPVTQDAPAPAAAPPAAAQAPAQPAQPAAAAPA